MSPLRCSYLNGRTLHFQLRQDSITVSMLRSEKLMTWSQGRSMVFSQRGIVAAEQPLASEAGATILAQGGSAADAAIATSAVMGVIQPMMNGMGGDLFAIEWNAKTGKVSGLNASGWSPEGLTLSYLRAQRQARRRIAAQIVLICQLL